MISRCRNALQMLPIVAFRSAESSAAFGDSAPPLATSN